MWADQSVLVMKRPPFTLLIVSFVFIATGGAIRGLALRHEEFCTIYIIYFTV